MKFYRFFVLHVWSAMIQEIRTEIENFEWYLNIAKLH